MASPVGQLNGLLQEASNLLKPDASTIVKAKIKARLLLVISVVRLLQLVSFPPRPRPPPPPPPPPLADAIPFNPPLD